MKPNEIVNVIQERINKLQERRRDFSIGTYLYEMYGFAIVELEGIILDIVDGCFEEIKKEEEGENAWEELFY